MSALQRARMIGASGLSRCVRGYLSNKSGRYRSTAWDRFSSSVLEGAFKGAFEGAYEGVFEGAKLMQGSWT